MREEQREGSGCGEVSFERRGFFFSFVGLLEHQNKNKKWITRRRHACGGGQFACENAPLCCARRDAL